MSKNYYVYLLASRKDGALYVGFTNDLLNRVHQHKNEINEGFTQKYNIKKLVWYEESNDVNEVIKREKQIKKWKRQWKIELIEKNNPNWEDLSHNWIE